MPSMGQALAFLDDLGLADDQIDRSAARREQYATDYGTLEDEGTRPDVVVAARSREDVAMVLEAANDHGVPVTPYAAGTSTEGHSVPHHGGITLDMTGLDAIVDVRPGDLQIDVQAGVIGSSVDEAVAEDGLFFPPLPSSGDMSTIGGMIATDASGMRTVKYGEVREWVRALEVVLTDGSVIEPGSRARKSSSGYNLKDLLVGSEGTLGVVTQATLELAGRPAEIRGGRAAFPTTAAAADAVADAVSAGTDLATVELMDPLSIRIANAYRDAGVPEEPMVFFEIHANHGIDAEVEFCRDIFQGHGMNAFDVSGEPDAFEALWASRRDIGHALTAYDPDLAMLTVGDVAVPISVYPEMIAYAHDLADEHDLLIPCFGHAGDGNVHYTILVDRDDPDHVTRGEKAAERIVEKAIALGGTATAEHGIGRRKRRYLSVEHGPRQVELMQGLKDVFDPEGILNPGSAIPRT